MGLQSNLYGSLIVCRKKNQEMIDLVYWIEQKKNSIEFLLYSQIVNKSRSGTLRRNKQINKKKILKSLGFDWSKRKTKKKIYSSTSHRMTWMIKIIINKRWDYITRTNEDKNKICLDNIDHRFRLHTHTYIWMFK